MKYRVMLPEPSAPFLLEPVKETEMVVEYNYEEGCDVEFLVGKGNELITRIPAHSQKLLAYPVFSAMLMYGRDVEYKMGPDGAQRKLRQIRLNWIGMKAFDNVMRFIYKQPVNLRAHKVTVETLKAAHAFVLPTLVQACVSHLSKIISQNNALFIFANVCGLCPDFENLEDLIQTGVNAPLRNATGKTGTEIQMRSLCVGLLSKCLEFIDAHAVQLLESDEIEDLDRSCLRFLLKRDSLDAPEQNIFHAIVRWAETECKRLHLPLTSESKRLVLQDLVYVVRYFQMSYFQFLIGPVNSCLLSHHVVGVILSEILGLHENDHAQNYAGVSKHAKDELRVLSSYWKYLSQPRTQRLNNGKWPENGEESVRATDKMSKKFSPVGKPKKALQKLKRVSTRLGKCCACIPCVRPGRVEKNGEQFLLINNNLSNTNSTPRKMATVAPERNKNSEKAGRPTRQNEPILSKVVDYAVQVLAFFLD